MERPITLTVSLSYEEGDIPGNTQAYTTVRALDDSPEHLEQAFRMAQRHIEGLLRDPMRPCGFPGPWADRPALSESRETSPESDRFIGRGRVSAY